MEGTLTQALPYVVGALCFVTALCLLRRPLEGLLRLAGRTGVGLGFLALFAPFGRLVGAALGVNLFNALVTLVLGVPGLGLLLLVQWVLT